jgi:hypothetical protein
LGRRFGEVGGGGGHLLRRWHLVERDPEAAGRLIFDGRAGSRFHLWSGGGLRRPLEGRFEALDGRFSRRGRQSGAGSPDDIGLDDEIVRTADHQEMLDVVPPQQDELTLAIQVIDIDHAEPRLAGTAAILPGQHQPASAIFPHEPAHQGEKHEDNREGDDVPGRLRGFDTESGQHVELSNPM